MHCVILAKIIRSIQQFTLSYIKIKYWFNPWLLVRHDDDDDDDDDD